MRKSINSHLFISAHFITFEISLKRHIYFHVNWPEAECMCEKIIFTLRINSLIVHIHANKFIGLREKKVRFVAIVLPIALIGAKTCIFLVLCHIEVDLTSDYNTTNGAGLCLSIRVRNCTYIMDRIWLILKLQYATNHLHTCVCSTGCSNNLQHTQPNEHFQLQKFWFAKPQKNMRNATLINWQRKNIFVYTSNRATTKKIVGIHCENIFACIDVHLNMKDTYVLHLLVAAIKQRAVCYILNG